MGCCWWYNRIQSIRNYKKLQNLQLNKTSLWIQNFAIVRKILHLFRENFAIDILNIVANSWTRFVGKPQNTQSMAFKISVKVISGFWIFRVSTFKCMQNLVDPSSPIEIAFFLKQYVKKHSYSWIPFSAGPRNCMSQVFKQISLVRSFLMVSGLHLRCSILVLWWFPDLRWSLWKSCFHSF